MPLYEYECPACGQDFEKRVKISEADDVVCSNCGSKHAHRKLSLIASRGQVGSTAGYGTVALPPGGG